MTTVDPKTLQPGRPAGVRCGTSVGDGSGAVSWPCTLRKGHTETDEPCYAVESQIAIARWQMWAAEHMSQPESPAITTPLAPLTEHEHDWVMDGTAFLRCAVCGELVKIAEPPGQRDVVADQFSAATGAQAAIRKDALQAEHHDSVVSSETDPEHAGQAEVSMLREDLVDVDEEAVRAEGERSIRLRQLAEIQVGDYVVEVDGNSEWVRVIRINS